MHETRRQLLRTGKDKFEDIQDSKRLIEKKIKELLASPNSESEPKLISEKLVALTYDMFLTNGSTAQEFGEIWEAFLVHAKTCDWYIDKNEECINALKAQFIGELKKRDDRIELLEKDTAPLRKATRWYTDTKSIAAFISSSIGLFALYQLWLTKIGGGE